MLCRKPYVRGIQSFGCGQCIPCRINRRRLWTSRLVLESMISGASYFVTLTYNEENLPSGQTLVPKDAQDFIKRLRHRIEPGKLRYFLVGEYGDQTQRPHYHMALFLNTPENQENLQVLCDIEWKMGFTYVGLLTPMSAAYTAGYVTKKMTSSVDSRLNGRNPEFARMSLKPGIGRPAMDSVVSVLKTNIGTSEILAVGDVPDHLMQGKSMMPLGRYLRRYLRVMLGLSEKAPPNHKYLSKAYIEREKIMAEVLDKKSKFYKWPTQKALLTKSLQSVINMHSRMKLKDGGKTI